MAADHVGVRGGGGGNYKHKCEKKKKKAQGQTATCAKKQNMAANHVREKPCDRKRETQN